MSRSAKAQAMTSQPKTPWKRPLLFADADTEQPEEQFEDAEGNSDGQGLEGRGLEKLSSIS